MTDRSYFSAERRDPPGAPALSLSEARGRTDPFGKLVRVHSRYVWRVLRCLGVRQADVDDLCQETFLIVHRKLPSYEARGALTSWIYGIALRVASDYRKRAYRRHESLVEHVPHVPSPDDQERALQNRQHWRLLERVTRELSEEQRQVFVLFEIEALTLREVSEVVGAPLQTVYSRLQSARKHIAEQLTRLREQGVLE